MREILFRGKTESAQWVYGSYVTCLDEDDKQELHLIIPHETEMYRFDFTGGSYVIPETIGQFTGLTDKNRKKIFEGDIVRLCSATYPIKVYWDCLGWKFLRNGKRVDGAFECDIKHDIELCEVIGNIHDNPELLGEQQ